MIANLNDETNSWELRESGKYERVPYDMQSAFSAHAYFMNNPSLSGRGKSLEYNAPVELDVKQRKKTNQ